MRKKKILSVCVISGLLALMGITGIGRVEDDLPTSLNRGIDCFADIDVVKDGDTFTIVGPTISEFVTQENGVIKIEDGMEVRLADIDCPEVRGRIKLEELEDALEAWWFVYDNFDGETVGLDIDDIYGVDKYGRLVCIVYCGDTNINKLLLDEDYAEEDDYPNAFDPKDW